MKINESIFKAYDIRGIYPSELNEEIVYRVGKAIQLLAGAKKVAVGHDSRISYPQLVESLTKGLIEQGVDVDLAGLTTTDAIYFAVGRLGYDAGINVTASHNPGEYNGIKVLKKGAVVLSGLDFKESVIKNKWPKIDEQGQIGKVEVLDDYIAFVLNKVDKSKFKPFKIAIDCGNGAAGPAVERLIKELPIEAIPLYFEPDGNFPNHLPNPLEEKNVAELKKAVKNEKCDFGVAYDGDGDRTFFIDEKGELIKGDLTLLFLAQAFLKKNPGAKITYSLICSKAVPEFIKQWGGQPIRTKVGHAFIKEVMKKEDALFGGEISSHFFYKDFFYTESGLLSLLLFMEVLSEEDKPLSEVIKSFKKYFNAAEISTPVADIPAKLKEIKEKYSDGKIDLLDGVTVEYKDWWFNVRPSNTEPLFRLSVEADSQELMEEKIEELLKVIKDY